MLSRRAFGTCALCAAIGLAAGAREALAQNSPAPSGLRRTVLHREEFPGSDYVTLLMTVEIDAGVNVPRHTHPGVESTYVLSGGGLLSVKGAPDQDVKAGQGFQIPAEVPHALRNGDAMTRLAITYVVEKNKPLVTLAPG
jgi:quercetin dioxygenase-like cupin family protein